MLLMLLIPVKKKRRLIQVFTKFQLLTNRITSKAQEHIRLES
jgi:hypothetical protein